jgi:hypothetical protein
MMQMADELNGRPSVFSIRNQETKGDNAFNSKTNSPF